MDNILKKTIREKIEKCNKQKGEDSTPEEILSINTSPANPKEQIKSKDTQAERRLSNLLEKVRSKSFISETMEKPLLKDKEITNEI